MEIMLKNKNGFQINISLSSFFIAFCDLFTDFPSYFKIFHSMIHYENYQYLLYVYIVCLEVTSCAKNSDICFHNYIFSFKFWIHL
jgi:hypothetical protein